MLLTSKTSAALVARPLLEEWAANFVYHFRFVGHKGPRFLSKILLAILSTPAVNDLTIAEYHPNTNIQTKQFSSFLFLGLFNYLSDRQTF